MSDYYLQVVIIKKTVPFLKAKEEAQKILQRSAKKKIAYRITADTWRFLNIPKTKFETRSFRTKIINDDISIVFGKLK